MRTSILISTYFKDLQFAHYSFRSIKKYASGFGSVTCVVPYPDVLMFYDIGHIYGITIEGFDEPANKGMLAHQDVIINADKWCPDADAILHMDPDCLFWHPATPADFFVDNKPIMLREKFEDFKHYDTRYGWKAAVREATGIDPVYETMVRHPSIHLKDTYRRTRERIANHTQMNPTEYVLGCENSFPQTFCEFATLGAVALDETPGDYHWIEQENGGKDYVYTKEKDKIVGLWSHDGIGRYREQLEEIVG